MNTRLKHLRTEILDISQEAFGKRLGVTGAGISKIESGNRTLTDQMFLAICREFNVNEEWLLNGIGDVFKKVHEEDEVAVYVSELLEDNGENPLYFIIKEIMHTYVQLDEKSKATIREACYKLLKNLNAKKEG